MNEDLIIKSLDEIKETLKDIHFKNQWILNLMMSHTKKLEDISIKIADHEARLIKLENKLDYNLDDMDCFKSRLI